MIQRANLKKLTTEILIELQTLDDPTQLFKSLGIRFYKQSTHYKLFSVIVTEKKKDLSKRKSEY